MKRLWPLSLMALLALAVATLVLAQGKGAAKGKGQSQAAAGQTQPGASGHSAQVTGSRGTDRARETQSLGQGQEHRGFDQPKGLTKKDHPAATKTKSKTKGKKS